MGRCHLVLQGQASQWLPLPPFSLPCCTHPLHCTGARAMDERATFVIRAHLHHERCVPQHKIALRTWPRLYLMVEIASSFSAAAFDCCKRAASCSHPMHSHALLLPCIGCASQVFCFTLCETLVLKFCLPPTIPTQHPSSMAFSWGLWW